MGKYTGPVCKLCRREGIKLYLKGEKCFTDKCPVERRGFPPGQHGLRRSKATEFGTRLREKQKLKRIYGLMERQFVRYFTLAERQTGSTGQNLLQILEQRLDNTVFRLGFASSRNQARQIVRNGHISMNGKSAMVPSTLVKPGDVIGVHEVYRSSAHHKRALERSQERGVPPWVEVKAEEGKGRLIRLPTQEEMNLPIQPQLVVEFYSR